MPEGINTIWDGQVFRQVPAEMARQMEADDMCQNLSRKFFSGTELKHRHQFAGYTTRELRAAPVSVEIPRLQDWKQYKKRTADHLGRPFSQITKADVIDYMEKHVGFVEV